MKDYNLLTFPSESKIDEELNDRTDNQDGNRQEQHPGKANEAWLAHS